MSRQIGSTAGPGSNARTLKERTRTSPTPGVNLPVLVLAKLDLVAMNTLRVPFAPLPSRCAVILMCVNDEVQ